VDIFTVYDTKKSAKLIVFSSTSTFAKHMIQ
jgi:hypothetical protein